MATRRGSFGNFNGEKMRINISPRDLNFKKHIAGFGDAKSNLIQASGYRKVTQLFGLFLLMDMDQQRFAEWLERRFGLYHNHSEMCTAQLNFIGKTLLTAKDGRNPDPCRANLRDGNIANVVDGLSEPPPGTIRSWIYIHGDINIPDEIRITKALQIFGKYLHCNNDQEFIDWLKNQLVALEYMSNNVAQAIATTSANNLHELGYMCGFCYL